LKGKTKLELDWADTRVPETTTSQTIGSLKVVMYPMARSQVLLRLENLSDNFDSNARPISANIHVLVERKLELDSHMCVGFMRNECISIKDASLDGLPQQ
jgi:hypothetical protein